MSTKCSDCEEPLADGWADACPKCGSQRKTHSVSATARIGFRASATATVIRFHERIADGADYIVRNAANEDDTGSFAAVVAICGTACEMALRYAFSSFVNQNPNPPAPAACAAVTELLNSTRQVHLRDKSGKQLQLWTDTTRDDWS